MKASDLWSVIAEMITAKDVIFRETNGARCFVDCHDAPQRRFVVNPGCTPPRAEKPQSRLATAKGGASGPVRFFSPRNSAAGDTSNVGSEIPNAW